MADARDPNAISNDELLDWTIQYGKQQRAVRSEVSQLRAGVIKKAKAAGANTRAMIDGFNDFSKGDLGETVAYLRERIRVINLLAAGAIKAEEVFDGSDMRLSNHSRTMNELFAASGAGYRVGRALGDLTECPYVPGTDLHAEWMTWYKRGEEEVQRVLGPSGEQAPLTRTKVKRDGVTVNTDTIKRGMAVTGDGIPEGSVIVMAEEGEQPPLFAQEPRAKRAKAQAKRPRGRPKKAANGRAAHA